MSAPGPSQVASSDLCTSDRIIVRVRDCMPEPVWAAASTIQCCVKSASSAVLGSVHSSLLAFPLYRSLYTRIRSLPIVEFYIYMWRVDPTLFVNTVFANYGLPMLMEGNIQYIPCALNGLHSSD
jgi:hypothetical protein